MELDLHEIVQRMLELVSQVHGRTHLQFTAYVYFFIKVLLKILLYLNTFPTVNDVYILISTLFVFKGFS